MRKLDSLTPIGLVIGVCMIIFGVVSTGGWSGISSFFDPASVFIVIGGVIAGLLVSFPFKGIAHVFTVIKQGFTHQERSIHHLIQTFVKLSERARREGLLSLEMEIGNESDPFIRKGILLAVDGMEPQMINDIMDADIIAMEERHRKGRVILEKAGEYAPSWGMIGTLIGLVLMLKNLEDPSSLGPSMAIALLTTLYGSLLANLFFIPLAAKLETQTEEEVFYKQVIIEGVIGVQSGQNPSILRQKLSAFISDKERKEAEEMEDEALNNEA
ncbi:flagellar motor protein MotP [Cytobacillus purgationiresistens]|uniref:Chemotaxis protein MotA n=1 Tax=Cytobacillus purgationiresistens TaxID=863449 RepID=A0ABU0ALK3_9BACI|nr:flagellar motor protein MotP [Cytobacillus purgationiresistens]MDQ0272144.1 chemotaxis protein MotA [Cytobacillus purgationiresistens]